MISKTKFFESLARCQAWNDNLLRTLTQMSNCNVWPQVPWLHTPKRVSTWFSKYFGSLNKIYWWVCISVSSVRMTVEMIELDHWILKSWSEVQVHGILLQYQTLQNLTLEKLKMLKMNWIINAIANWIIFTHHPWSVAYHVRINKPQNLIHYDIPNNMTHTHDLLTPC